MMKRRGAGAQPNTEQRRERPSKCLRERCDLAKGPDLPVSHDPLPEAKSRLCSAEAAHRFDSMRRGIPWQFHEET
jgi:hypothetical protein